ncbi:MAG: PfkB family carbohydrate kinase [Rectinemataceae bacterium]
MELKLAKNKRIAVVGGANFDLQGMVAGAYSPGDSNPGFVSRAPGGVGRNIAENLIRLDFDVDFVTAVGTDAASGDLVRECENLGMDVSGILAAPGHCPTYLCLLDRGGGLIGAVSDMVAMETLDPGALAARRGRFDTADAIVVDANLRADSIAWLAANYGRRSAAASRVRPILIFDPVSAAKAGRAASCLSEFDIVKPNLAECAILAGSNPVAESPALEIEKTLSLAGRFPGELYLSLGSGGIRYSTLKGESGSLELPEPGRRPHTVSRSGAGDAACAALAASALSGFAPKEKAACALAAALIAAASESPVNPEMSADGLLELAAFILHDAEEKR